MLIDLLLRLRKRTRLCSENLRELCRHPGHDDIGGALIFGLSCPKTDTAKHARFTAHSGLIRKVGFSYHRGPPSGWGGLQGLLQVERGYEHAAEWTAGTEPRSLVVTAVWVRGALYGSVPGLVSGCVRAFSTELVQYGARCSTVHSATQLDSLCAPRRLCRPSLCPRVGELRSRREEPSVARPAALRDAAFGASHESSPPPAPRCHGPVISSDMIGSRLIGGALPLCARGPAGRQSPSHTWKLRRNPSVKLLLSPREAGISRVVDLVVNS